MSQKQHGQKNPYAVQTFLDDLNFPVGKDELIDHTRAQNAPDEVLQMLGMIDNQQYDNPDDVVAAINLVEQEFESTQGGEQPSGGGARPQA